MFLIEIENLRSLNMRSRNESKVDAKEKRAQVQNLQEPFIKSIWLTTLGSVIYDGPCHTDSHLIIALLYYRLFIIFVIRRTCKGPRCNFQLQFAEGRLFMHSTHLDGAAMAEQLLGSALLTLFLAFVLTAFLAVKARNNNRHGRSHPSNPPPGKFGWPIVGETLQYLRHLRSCKPSEFFDIRIAKYGRVFKTSLFGHPTAVFCEPAGNRFLFANENKLVVNSWPTSVATLFRNSLITAVGDDAKRLRRVLMSFLKPEALQKLVGRVDSITRNHLATHWIGKQEVTVFPLVQEHTFSLACSLFAGVEDKDEQARLSAHFHILEKGVLQIPIDLPGTRYHRARRAADAIRRELQRKIDCRLANGSAAARQDLLSYLLCNVDELGISLTHDEVKDNILLLLYAAHDTSTSTLTMLLKYLAEQPACYRDVLSEQLEIARLKEGGELLEWEDLQKMKYSWRVAQEVLRLMPPVQGAFRRAITDFTYHGFTIPKGWKIQWTVNSTHRKSEYFRDPEKFDPSRFEGEGPAPYTFVPFGGGPRMCPGNEFARMEILVFLHNLVKKFNSDLGLPNEKVMPDPMPTPLNGLPIKLRLHK